MKLDLEEPFKSLWRKGYLREDKQGRKRVDLFNTSVDRSTISYARYLVCVDLGYILNQNYEVDHKNRDKSDDSLGNLQILTKEDHRLKNSKEMSTGRTKVKLICPQCNKEFERDRRLVRKQAFPKCSRRCNGLYSYENKISMFKSTKQE